MIDPYITFKVHTDKAHMLLHRTVAFDHLKVAVRSPFYSPVKQQIQNSKLNKVKNILKGNEQ